MVLPNRSDEKTGFVVPVGEEVVDLIIGHWSKGGGGGLPHGRLGDDGLQA